MHPEIAAVLNGESDWCLIHGDSREILKTIPDKSVNAIVTDAPYGVGIDYGCFDDTSENVRELASIVVPEFKRIANVSFVFTGIQNMFDWPKPDWTLSWYIPAGASSGKFGFTCWQPIVAYGKDQYLVNGKGRMQDAFTKMATKNDNQHPCAKPLDVMKWTIKRGTLLEADIICDPFTGSGTTGEAAIKMGRRFIGIELDERWIPRARARLEAAHRQQRLTL